MKLTNPATDELRHAFAIGVAKYTLSQYGEYFTSEGLFVGSRSTLPEWDVSMDAVLPWLEKCDSFRIERRGTSPEIHVIVWPDISIKSEGVSVYFAHADKNEARAAVIALLRAHGVEVEFTS